jgi:hypothetical protein
MRRWKDRFWPTIDSPASARLAVDRAARITTIWAFVNIALELVLFFSGTRVTERGPVGTSTSGIAFLLAGVLFGLIAWKVRCMSRGWTLGGFCLALFMLVADLVSAPSPFALIALGVVFVYFFNALRAVVSYERLVADQPISEVLGG